MAKNKKAKKAHKKKRGNGAAVVEEHVLDRLYLVIDSRKGADPETSYTARVSARSKPDLVPSLSIEVIRISPAP